MHVLLGVEGVSPGSETTDRIVNVDRYARAGIPFSRRVEQAATGVPLVCTYILDPAARLYRDGDVFTGAVKAVAPFAVHVGLGVLWPHARPAHPSPCALPRRTLDAATSG